MQLRVHTSRAPPLAKLVGGVAVGLLLLGLINATYQVVRKRSELWFPLSGALYKTPADTWQSYAPLFREYATHVITPDFLAALAQVEGSGNPLARTYWRWGWNRHPFDVYRPASSAVGMFQMTDATYAQAKRYCIRHHVVVELCGAGSTARVVPADAIELTSAHLDRSVAAILERRRLTSVTLERKQSLAAVVHLCGAAAGNAFAKRGFRPSTAQHCGDHDLRDYLMRVRTMEFTFHRLGADT